MEIRPVEDHVELLTELSTVQNIELKDALLARQSNYEPLSNINPKLILYPLDKLNEVSNDNDLIRVQESLIVHDLLENLMGLSGTYIRYNNEYNPYNGDVPEFKIAKKLDTSLKSFSKKILQYGSYFVALNNASERWTDIKYGVVLQSLSYEIKTFINETYLPLLVNRLERMYFEDPNFSIREFKQILNDSETGKQLTLLYDFITRIEEEMVKRQNSDLQQLSIDNFLLEMEQFNQNDDLTPIFIERKISPIAKGGTILKILYRMILEQLGDSNSVIFLQDLLIKISDSYYKTLHGWMTQGELTDPCDEFMIIDTMPYINNVSMSNPIECDRVWLTQYGIRKDGLLDKFSLTNNNNNSNNNSNKLLFKILSTGKFLNVIKKSLNINHIPITQEQEAEGSVQISNFVELMEGTNFELYVEKWYNRANELCLKLLIDGYHLPKIIDDLSKWYFGDKNGYNINVILKGSLVELTRRYSERYSNNIENRIKIKFENIKNELLTLELHHNNHTSNPTNYEKNDIILKLLTVQLDKEPFDDVISQYINSELQTIGNSNKLNTIDSIRDMVMKEFENSITSNKKNDNNERTNVRNDGTEMNQNPNKSNNNIYYMKFDIGIPYPLNMIINRSCILQYQLINRYLNILRYHNVLLEETWMEINKNTIWKYPNYNKDIKDKIIKRSRVLHNGMNNFIKSIMEYFHEDVIRNEMDKIVCCLSSFASSSPSDGNIDINELQSQLAESLTNILHDGCLIKLIKLQLQIFDIINKFCKFLLSMKDKLIQLDYNLFTMYQEKGKGKEQGKEQVKERERETVNKLNYDEDTNIIKISEYIEFIKVVTKSFQDHRETLIEGLWYHYEGKTHPLFNYHHGVGSTMNEYNSNIGVISHGSRLIASTVNMSKQQEP